MVNKTLKKGLISDGRMTGVRYQGPGGHLEAIWGPVWEVSLEVILGPFWVHSGSILDLFLDPISETS